MRLQNRKLSAKHNDESSFPFLLGSSNLIIIFNICTKFVAVYIRISIQYVTYFQIWNEYRGLWGKLICFFFYILFGILDHVNLDNLERWGDRETFGDWPQNLHSPLKDGRSLTLVKKIWWKSGRLPPFSRSKKNGGVWSLFRDIYIIVMTYSHKILL